MRILVTGAAGSIGRSLVASLPPLGHEVRGFDRVEMPTGPIRADGALLDVDVDPAAVGALDHVVGDLADGPTLEAAMDGVDVVVHLAAIAKETGFATAMDSHVTGTWWVLEAMRRTGVPRIVLGSSNHAVGFHGHTDRLGVDARLRPDTFYGVAKAASEALCSFYVDRHEMAAVVLRIGSFAGRPRSRRHLSTWLSPGDAARLVDASATADLVPLQNYAVVWGISNNTRGWWDLGPGRDIGYHPRDDAEDFAPEIEAEPESEQDGLDARRVGGPYTRMLPDGR